MKISFTDSVRLAQFITVEHPGCTGGSGFQAVFKCFYAYSYIIEFVPMMGHGLKTRSKRETDGKIQVNTFTNDLPIYLPQILSTYHGYQSPITKHVEMLNKIHIHPFKCKYELLLKEEEKSPGQKYGEK